MEKTPRIKKPQSSLVRPLAAFIRQFHLLIFFVAVVACLSVAVILINQTLTESTDETYTSPINAGSIDQTTLKRIEPYHTSDEPSPTPALPSGRTNPFSE
jgi:hypothetical protein